MKTDNTKQATLDAIAAVREAFIEGRTSGRIEQQHDKAAWTNSAARARLGTISRRALDIFLAEEES